MKVFSIISTESRLLGNKKHISILHYILHQRKSTSTVFWHTKILQKSNLKATFPAAVTRIGIL